MKVAVAVVVLGVGGGIALAVWVWCGGEVARVVGSEKTGAVNVVSTPIAVVSSSAAAAYRGAGKLLVVESPGRSFDEYPEYPPFPPVWHERSRRAWEKNAPARAMVREARKFGELVVEGDEREFLKVAWAVAAELADAAMWSHVNGDNREAVELLGELRHLTTLLRKSAEKGTFMRATVAANIDSMALRKLMAIAPGLEFGEVGSERVLGVEDGRELIAMLLDGPSVDGLVATAREEMIEKNMMMGTDLEVNLEVVERTHRRVYGESVMAAMSVGAQMYRCEHRSWPNEAGELVPKYLAEIPLDPWGDGKERFGYVLVRGGLPGSPDGGDRPMVYSREESQDGLFYVVNGPKYGFYFLQRSNGLGAEQKRGGQFRDLARWVPRGDVPAGVPTTRALGR